MTFKMCDFDAMRDWLKRCSGPKPIRKGRVMYFDNLRYREDYEAIYNFITMMGGEIDYDNLA